MTLPDIFKDKFFYPKLALAIIFMLQPMIGFLVSFDPGDCDDKAVHFFSAAFSNANNSQKDQFRTFLEPVENNLKNEPRWQREAFRLQTPFAYPLSNIFISSAYKSGMSTDDSVKTGLFAVALVAILAVVFLSSKTQFGFWPGLLVVNLIAFYSVKLNFITSGLIPRNMHPFIAYAPRGAGALFAIPIILTFAQKRWVLFIISLSLMFAWHTALGALNLPIVLISALIYVLIEKFHLHQKNLFFIISFFLSLIFLVISKVQGLPIIVALDSLILIGCFTHKRLIKFPSFISKAFIFSIIYLFVIITISGIAENVKVSTFLTTHFNQPVLAEISDRLSGIKYSIVVLALVLFIKLLLLKFKIKIDSPKITLGVIVILFFLMLNHLTEYMWVARKSTGFFWNTCQQTDLIKLPGDSQKLTTSNEPQFFNSLGKYLFDLSNSK